MCHSIIEAAAKKSCVLHQTGFSLFSNYTVLVSMNQSELIYRNTYGQPESRNVYDYMGAKKTVQPARLIQPGFVQV